MNGYWCGYPMMKKVEDRPMFTHFDRIQERGRHADGRTDGRTPSDAIGRACIASRAKNDVYNCELDVQRVR